MNTFMPRRPVGETPEFCRAPWFAIRVKSNFEKKVATGLRNKGLEEFLPLYQSRRREKRISSISACRYIPRTAFTLTLITRFSLLLLTVSDASLSAFVLPRAPPSPFLSPGLHF